MPQRLYVNDLMSIGLVDAGDNPTATVEIYKRSNMRDGNTASGIVDDKTGGTGRDSKVRTMSLPDLSNVGDDDLRKSIEDAFDGITKERDTLNEKVDALTAKVDELTDDGEEEPDPLAKADPVVKAEIERLRKERDEDRQALEAEVAKRRDAEFISKDYMPLLGKAENMGPVLRRIADKADTDDFEQLETALKAVAGQKELAAIFKEAGHAADGTVDPKSKQQAWVEKNRRDDETEAEARARFWKTDEGKAIRKEQAAEQRS